MSEQHVEAIQGLLEIAKQAMPDTFYLSDSRVRAARELIGEDPDKMPDQCEACDDTEGPFCEGCSCCAECCNCTETDCDCDMCKDRRENADG